MMNKPTVTDWSIGTACMIVAGCALVQKHAWHWNWHHSLGANFHIAIAICSVLLAVRLGYVAVMNRRKGQPWHQIALACALTTLLVTVGGILSVVVMALILGLVCLGGDLFDGVGSYFEAADALTGSAPKKKPHEARHAASS